MLADSNFYDSVLRELLFALGAALFVANLVGIELNFTQQLIVFFTAMIGAIGAPGIPSAGMV